MNGRWLTIDANELNMSERTIEEKENMQAMITSNYGKPRIDWFASSIIALAVHPIFLRLEARNQLKFHIWRKQPTDFADVLAGVIGALYCPGQGIIQMRLSVITESAMHNAPDANYSSLYSFSDFKSQSHAASGPRHQKLSSELKLLRAVSV